MQYDAAYAVYSEQITYHAWTRMGQRGISLAKIELVMEYGRPAHIRGAEVYAIGRREVAQARKKGIDLSSLEGLKVICSHDDNSVITLYRNREYSGLKSRFCRKFKPEHAKKRDYMRERLRRLSRGGF